MEVAITRVEHIGHAQTVRGAELGDPGQHLRQLAARNGAVHAEIVRRDPAYGGKGGLASGPKGLAFGLGFRHPHKLNAAMGGDGADPFAELSALGLRAVQFDDQQGRAVDGIADLHERLGGADRRIVHHLQARRNDARRNDVADHRARRFHRVEPQEQRFGGFRLWQDAHGHLGDDAQQTLGPGDQPQQIITLGVHRLAAQAHHLAAHQHQFAAQQVVGGQTVLQAVNPAGILRHIAADGAGDLTGRVGRIVEPFGLNGGGDRQVGDPRLHHGAAVRVVHL